MKLKKCVLLLPTTYNDREKVPPALLTDLLKEIDRTFDGHTVDGLCDGVYKMDDGSMVSDRLLKVWVAIAPSRVDEVRTLAARIARLLRQESLCFEVTEAEVEFVRPLPETGELA